MGGEAIESIPQRSSLRQASGSVFLAGIGASAGRHCGADGRMGAIRWKTDQLSSLDGSDGQHFWGWFQGGRTRSTWCHRVFCICSELRTTTLTKSICGDARRYCNKRCVREDCGNARPPWWRGENPGFEGISVDGIFSGIL